MSREIRDLIRQMSRANPLWGAPRIHGELLKLGIEVSQATVGRYLPRRPKVPSPTWCSFLHNHMRDTAAVDMFAVVTAGFQILYALVPPPKPHASLARQGLSGASSCTAALCRQRCRLPTGRRPAPSLRASRSLNFSR